MNRDTKLSVIRQYIADGDSMERVAGSHGIETAEVSSIIRHYGFNSRRTGAFQSGEDRGAFRSEAIDSDFDSILEKYLNGVDRGTMHSTFRQFLDSEHCKKRPVKSNLDKSVLESACSSNIGSFKPKKVSTSRTQSSTGGYDEFDEFIGVVLFVTVILMFVLKSIPFWTRLGVSVVLGVVIWGFLKAKINAKKNRSSFEDTPLAKRQREREGIKDVKRTDNSTKGQRIFKNILIGIVVYVVIWRLINYGHL